MSSIELPTELENYTLHPDAHIPPEIWKKMKHFVHVGNPNEWMSKIKLDGQGIEYKDLPAAFKLNYELLLSSREGLDASLQIMQRASNTYPYTETDVRKMYQFNEKLIMSHVLKTMGIFLTEIEKNIVIYALRGAEFFEDMTKKYSKQSLKTEVKRIRVLDSNNEESYFVGIGEVPALEDGMESPKTFLMPDDCLSTGMTQMALLERLFQQGYKPEHVIMVFTIGTTAGIKYAYDKFSELVTKYNLNCRLDLQCGCLCRFVNDKMYLIDKNGDPVVNDMGDWNTSLDTVIHSPLTNEG
ncbi:MAG: hypothetical protein ABIM99_03980 [Candidatus Dojkabacteria bacterium]